MQVPSPPVSWRIAKDYHYAEVLPFTIVDRDLMGVGAAIELADARLMAAAPEMASVLRQLLAAKLLPLGARAAIRAVLIKAYGVFKTGEV